MVHLLNLLAAIALLVWGTQIVRTGILRVFGENLRHVLAVAWPRACRRCWPGVGVTSLIQSSTATCLIVISFLGRTLVTLSAALAVMLGADVGTALMAVVFSLDLSWLSPLLIFVGVVIVRRPREVHRRPARPRGDRPRADPAVAAADHGGDAAADRGAGGACTAGRTAPAT